MILRKFPRGAGFLPVIQVLRLLLLLIQFSALPEMAISVAVYPDGGRNVIPVIRNKSHRPQPYNDGTVMAHVIGSAGMNFLYYFHILGVACENTDPKFYKIIQTDFQFCLNKTGPLPSQLRKEPLGSIPKPCVDWKIHRPCYKNLADDYDECLMDKPGLVKKGTDALRFTHAYAKFICGNIVDTEAHLLDRYTKHDLVVDGVFQCFPHLQDRIVNCIKKDKISKTLCSKFFIVHACFGKYYNDDNCRDEQPILYMDDLFRNMSTSLSCPGRDDHWYTTKPPGPTYRPPTNGWSSPTPSTPIYHDHHDHHHHHHHEELPSRKGWTSREEHSVKENPWPGEQGRPWSTEREREPFIRDPPRYSERPEYQPSYNTPGRDRGWSSSERGRERERVHSDKGRDRYMDSHTNRPYPDKHWNNRPWVDVMDRGSTGMSRPWSQREEDRDTSSGRRGEWSSSTRGPVSSSYKYDSRNRERERDPSVSSMERGKYNENQRFYYSSSSTPRGPGGESVTYTLPPAGFARTRTPKDVAEDISSSSIASVSENDEDNDSKYYTLRPSSLADKTSTGDLGYNFFSFE